MEATSTLHQYFYSVQKPCMSKQKTEQGCVLQASEWYREDLVGQAIQESGTSRTALFLTTKLHPRHHGFNTFLQQIRSSFVNLRTSYLDLVLFTTHGKSLICAALYMSFKKRGSTQADLSCKYCNSA